MHNPKYKYIEVNTYFHVNVRHFPAHYRNEFSANAVRFQFCELLEFPCNEWYPILWRVWAALQFDEFMFWWRTPLIVWLRHSAGVFVNFLSSTCVSIGWTNQRSRTEDVQFIHSFKGNSNNLLVEANRFAVNRLRGKIEMNKKVQDCLRMQRCFYRLSVSLVFFVIQCADLNNNTTRIHPSIDGSIY